MSLKADDLLAAVQKAVATVAAVAPTDVELASRLSVTAEKQYRSLESSAGYKVFEAFIQNVQRDDPT